MCGWWAGYVSWESGKTCRLMGGLARLVESSVVFRNDCTHGVCLSQECKYLPSMYEVVSKLAARCTAIRRHDADTDDCIIETLKS